MERQAAIERRARDERPHPLSSDHLLFKGAHGFRAVPPPAPLREQLDAPDGHRTLVRATDLVFQRADLIARLGVDYCRSLAPGIETQPCASSGFCHPEPLLCTSPSA